MHSAPSVNYPVGRSRFEGLAIAAAALAAGAGLAVWARAAAAPAAGVALAAALVLATAAAALLGWWRTPTRRLGWDGQDWRLDGQPLGALDCIADLQSVLLLRCRDASGRPRWRIRQTWVWPERAADPVHWADLRRAVYSRARPETPSDEPSRTAEP